MSAIPFVRISALPVSGPVTGREPAYEVLPAHAATPQRVVAVAVNASALLQPGSHLARLLAAAPRADLLIASDEPRLQPVRVPVRPSPAAELVNPTAEALDIDDLPPMELDAEAAAELELELPTAVVIDDLGLPGLRVHRLDLPVPLAGRAEDDLVAAMSELVGFDPEPGVVCLAPAPVDADGDVVSRAAQRIARVYGLPLLRFRCRELAGAGAVTTG